MKISKKKFVLMVLSIAIAVISLALLIIDWASSSVNITTHPVFTFFLVFFSGFGIMTLVLGFIDKSPWFFFLSAILLDLVLIYCLIGYAHLAWYIVLIAAIVLLIIVSAFSLIKAGNKTEDIALNKSPDYKDYKQRKAEKEEAEANEEKPELPKIKSFKD